MVIEPTVITVLTNPVNTFVIYTYIYIDYNCITGTYMPNTQ